MLEPKQQARNQQLLFVLELTQALLMWGTLVRKTLEMPDTQDEQKLGCGYTLLFNMTSGTVDSKSLLCPFHLAEELLISFNAALESLH